MDIVIGIFIGPIFLLLLLIHHELTDIRRALSEQEKPE